MLTKSELQYTQELMTLATRDNFAAHAMGALLHSYYDYTAHDFKKIAKDAYQVADAMMKQREAKPTSKVAKTRAKRRDQR